MHLHAHTQRHTHMHTPHSSLIVDLDARHPWTEMVHHHIPGWIEVEGRDVTEGQSSEQHIHAQRTAFSRLSPSTLSSVTCSTSSVDVVLICQEALLSVAMLPV